MRLQSHVWVSAFLRVEAAEGGFPAIIRRGAAEAGAIFIQHEHSNGTLSLYGPAPQAQFSADAPVMRSFERVFDHAERQAALDWLDRQIRFDADCWIVGTERREGPPKLVADP